MSGPRWILVSLLCVVRPTMVSQASEWKFGYESAGPVSLPAWLAADSVKRALEYQRRDTLVGFVRDLNGDGVSDWALRASRHVCGTNCWYTLVDGRSRRPLGTVGGTLCVARRPVVNGYPVIECYGHSSATSGYLGVAVFDGRAYIDVSSVYVEGESASGWFKRHENVPFVRPPASRQ